MNTTMLESPSSFHVIVNYEQRLCADLECASLLSWVAEGAGKAKRRAAPQVRRGGNNKADQLPAGLSKMGGFGKKGAKARQSQASQTERIWRFAARTHID
eukprot:1668807-Amphidinium_carterae.1